MAFLTCGNAQIHYEKLESRDPRATQTIIFIHPTGLDMYCWNEIIPLFLENYHVVRYDLRGHGDSTVGDGDLSISRLADDIQCLVNTLKLDTYHIVAQGFGGVSAIEYAARGFSGLKTLTLLAVPVHFPRELGKKIVAERKMQVKGHETMLHKAQLIIDKFMLYPTQERVERILHAFEKVTPHVYFEIFDVDSLNRAQQNIQNVTIPILVLSGSDDETFPPELNSAILNFNTNARYYTVPYSSFLIQMDQPNLMVEWIGKFIMKHQNNMINQEIASYAQTLYAEMYREIREKMKGKAEATLPTLQVNIMKGLDVFLNGKRLVGGWGQRKAKQILMYLIIQQSVTRDELCDLVWPDVDLKTARSRLRVSIHYLNKLLNPMSDHYFLLVTEREHIFLQANIESDIVLHVAAIKRAHQETDIVKKVELYKRIVADRTENPLPGLYETWFINYRNWLEKEWVDMVMFLSDYYESIGDIKQALYYCQIALEYYIDDFMIINRQEYLKSKLEKIKNS
ncbi:alpha/beta fold hydrolase [Ornithinibacillus massiliensis]|uniref:Alpha/beta fold hydrolase n=1 Tax=Ornithinibacillus massiliensis TaxID=1944633 RepID=A0ABS5M9D3_9BACI|nr:alpha/beta hydrolase [Ornithinibacillus massiliensis]MBS3678915.1 alpha/beta fold hydrolase [Ornithinibacillus massiliensis]